MTTDERLKEIEDIATLNLPIPSEQWRVDTVLWLISELRAALEREKIAVEALRFYADFNKFTTHEKVTHEKTGTYYTRESASKKALDALSEINRLRERE